MRAERYSTYEMADIEIYGQSLRLRATVANLSTTGASLVLTPSEKSLQRGDLINLTVELSSLDRVYNVDAEVVWTKDSQVGVCFVKKDEVVSRIFLKSQQ